MCSNLYLLMWPKSEGKYLLFQGVRREVGNHAKVLNKTLPESARMSSVPTKDRGRINPKPKTSSSPSLKSDSFGSLLSEEANSFSSEPTNGPLVSLSDNKIRQTTETQMSSGLGTDAEQGLERAGNRSTLLKESIGHTEVEVTAGALLGFLVGLAMYSIM